VGATARRLQLHPNTVHYRLRRLERLTGRDVRRFDDVVDLVAALRLLAG
jgi:DNA-binding PucR family transcriptional regulator